MKATKMLRVSLWIQITDFGLTYGVQDKTPIILAPIISFSIAQEKIKKLKKYAAILFWWSKSIRISIFLMSFQLHIT